MGYFIVENYYNSKTVEQKAMFTLYNNDDEVSKKKNVKSLQSMNSTLVVFNNVNTVRLEM